MKQRELITFLGRAAVATRIAIPDIEKLWGNITSERADRNSPRAARHPGRTRGFR
jgi:hypothetical protein